MADGEVVSKSQANKIGEALRHGEMTAELIERLSAYREQLVREAKTASDAVRSLTLCPVTPREGKSTESIVAKLQRQSVSLSRMQDIVGCRIVVDTMVEQEALALRIEARFSDSRLVDRRVDPSYGYRAIHFILRWCDAPYEVQVRTRLQHAWAQTVERLSDRRFPGLKYGQANGEIPEIIAKISETIHRIEKIELKVFVDRRPGSVQRQTTEIQSLRASIIDLLGIL